MRTRNNIMIFDTETVGTFNTPLVHDIGFVIVDKHFNIIHKDRFLVKELHKMGNWILKTSDFYSEYTKDYETARKTEKVLEWSEISASIAETIRTYKVTTISAYNLQFDYKAIKYTDDMFNKKRHLSKVLDQKSKALLCIYNLACETILNTDEYRNFCEEHNYFTEKGNYKTSAEIAYRFITGETEYDEKHTALSDSEDEKQILEYICTHVKKETLKYGLFYNCWKKVQK